MKATDVEAIENAVVSFASAIREKLDARFSGEPEDQLRSPFENLASAVGLSLQRRVLLIGEIMLREERGKPDYGMVVDGLMTGHIELKAFGKGSNPQTFRGHDAKQWIKFKALPNIIYTDGGSWRLFRRGELVRGCELLDRSFSSASNPRGPRELIALFQEFLNWKPSPPKSPKELATFIAPLCRLLRDDVLIAIESQVPAVLAAAADWRRYLFPEVTAEEFADAYAQTVTFTLLLARSYGADTLNLDRAVAALDKSSNALLSRALRVLTDPQVQTSLGASLGIIQRVVNEVPTGTMTGGLTDPWLHFYEDFLQEYDPELRKDAGAYLHTSAGSRMPSSTCRRASREAPQ